VDTLQTQGSVRGLSPLTENSRSFSPFSPSNERMREIVFCLVLAAGPSGFGIGESNILAAGEWSAPVTNQLGDAAIRGRLLICETPARRPGSATDTALYLEFQECSGTIGKEVAICQGFDALHCSVVDRSGINMSTRYSGITSWPPRCNVNLAPYSSFRFRVSPYGSGRSKNGVWNFALPGGGMLSCQFHPYRHLRLRHLHHPRSRGAFRYGEKSQHVERHARPSAGQAPHQDAGAGKRRG
jgi:hypothetical protein